MSQTECRGAGTGGAAWAAVTLPSCNGGATGECGVPDLFDLNNIQIKSKYAIGL